MRMDKEKIKQKIKELEALLEESEDKADSEFILKLNTGSLYYHGDGVICDDTDAVAYKDCFNRFLQESQAKIAAKRMSAQNELLQMAFILNGNWKPDFTNPSERKYFVFFAYDKSEFRSDYNSCYSYGLVYFKDYPLKYFLATASDNLKAYIKGELQ